MADSDEPDDPVGYKKPPKANQFKPGQSGNVKGRPRGSRNLSTIIETELNARVTVTENGKSKKLSKKELLGKRLVNNSVTGDHKSMAMLLTMQRDQEGRDAQNLGAVYLPRREDDLVIQSMLARIRSGYAPISDPVPPPADTDIADPTEGPEALEE